MNAERARLARRTGLVSLVVGGCTVLMAKSMEQPVMRTAPRWLTEGDRIQRQVDWSREQEQARWFTRIGWILAGSGAVLVGLSYALEDRGLAALTEKPAETGAVEGAGNKWLPWVIGAIALGGLGTIVAKMAGRPRLVYEEQRGGAYGDVVDTRAKYSHYATAKDRLAEGRGLPYDQQYVDAVEHARSTGRPRRARVGHGEIVTIDPREPAHKLKIPSGPYRDNRDHIGIPKIVHAHRDAYEARRTDDLEGEARAEDVLHEHWHNATPMSRFGRTTSR